MDLVLLNYFSVLAKCRNFSVAADEVFLSQSSISKRIKGLEDQLGTELFVRNPRSVELTEVGRALLPYARDISDDLELLRRELTSTRNNDSALRIAAISFLSYYGVTNQVASYMNQHTKVNIGLKEIGSHFGLEMLKSGQVDAVMMFSKLLSDQKYDKYPLANDRMVALMNESNPLAVRDQIQIGDLKDQELIVISEHDEPFFQLFIREEFEKAGIIPHIRSYRVWIGAIESVVRQCGSIAILPERVAQRLCHRGTVYRVISGFPPFSFSIITNANCHKYILEDFIQYLTRQR